MWFSMLIGLLVVLRCSLLVYFIISGGKYLYPDTPMYLELATNLIENQVFSMSREAPFIPEVFRTPGYPVFLALISELGMESLYWVVFWQELVYALAVFIFYHYGKSLFDRNLLRAGVVFLLLEPGGLAYPKLLLSETLFMPFLFTGLLAIGLYLRQTNWRYLLVSGIAMGLGAMVRPAILYLPVIAAITLIFFQFRNRQRWLHVGILLLTFSVVVSPWLLRNYHFFGKAFMSGQLSHMLANYHVSKVWEHTRGYTQKQGQSAIQGLIGKAKAEQEKVLARTLTPVEFFTLQQQVAVAELAKYPLEYLIQWGGGILKTISGPNLIDFYDIFNFHPQRPHLFQVLAERGYSGIFYYLSNLDLLFLVNVIFTLGMAFFALLGVPCILRSRDRFFWLLLLSNFYFICIAGPMGEPRYRFPVGVFWFIQAFLGWRWFMAFVNLQCRETSVSG